MSASLASPPAQAASRRAERPRPPPRSRPLARTCSPPPRRVPARRPAAHPPWHCSAPALQLGHHPDSTPLQPTRIRQDSWDIDYQATLNVLEEGRRQGAKHFVLLSAICVQKPTLTFQKAKLKFEAALQASALLPLLCCPVLRCSGSEDQCVADVGIGSGLPQLHAGLWSVQLGAERRLRATLGAARNPSKRTRGLIAISSTND